MLATLKTACHGVSSLDARGSSNTYSRPEPDSSQVNRDRFKWAYKLPRCEGTFTIERIDKWMGNENQC